VSFKYEANTLQVIIRLMGKSNSLTKEVINLINYGTNTDLQQAVRYCIGEVTQEEEI